MTKTIRTEHERRVTVLYPSASIDEQATKDKKKLRVAAYCRVSTELEEQQASFTAQKDFYERTLSANKDYNFIGIYADEGVSGTGIKKREGFLRMMEDCRNQIVDMVITKSVSRFGRNTVDCLNAIRELKSLRIDVFFEKENIHTMRSEGELLLTLMMAVAEAESESISENVKWGLRKRVEQGHSTVLCSRPYGYDRGPDGLVIKDDEAIVVCRIFQEFLDGYSYTDIARHLTEDGIQTYTNNGKWVNVVIKQILENEKYKGDFCYLKSYVADPISKKKKTNKGELPRYYLAGTHTWIIDPEIWECAQLEIQRRSAFYKEHHTCPVLNTEDAPFQTKIICGVCGQAIARRSHTKYLVCTSYEKLRNSSNRGNLACRHIRIERSTPERAFLKAWNSLVKNYDQYVPEWQAIFKHGDPLQRYRARELMRLVTEVGHIEDMPFELCIKVLDHIEVTLDSLLHVVFLSGTLVN